MVEVLRHYRTLLRPGYAVLVIGPWGTGKTHQVLACVPEAERLYVSFFGLSSAEEVHAAVLAAAFPDARTATKAMKAVEDVGKGSGWGVVATAVSGFATAVLRQQLKPDRVLVFDDVERCSLDLVTLLGVINDYLEHRGFHVVLIADEREFRDREAGDFKRFREKLVGHAIEVEPQTEQAFAAFLARIEDEELRARVAQHRDAILQAFERANASSLRVLRTAIDDVVRLLETLSPEHAERGDAVADLVRLLVTLAVEVEVGEVCKDDLEKRVLFGNGLWAEVQKTRKGEVSALDKASKRHRGTELRDPLLPNELAIDMIVHGRFDPNALTEALNRDARFVGPARAPAWRIIWHNEDADVVVEQAVETFPRAAGAARARRSGRDAARLLPARPPGGPRLRAGGRERRGGGQGEHSLHRRSLRRPPSTIAAPRHVRGIHCGWFLWGPRLRPFWRRGVERQPT